MKRKLLNTGQGCPVNRQARCLTYIGIGLVVLALAGCTVRGGWPRFVRPGEAWGWHQAQPQEPGK